MLSMLLFLAVTLQADTGRFEAPAQALRPATIQEVTEADGLQGLSPATETTRGRVLSDNAPGCENRTTQVAEPNVAGNLMWRSGDQAVGLYRLLDRRIGGCSAPILVNERVPGSNAIGREVGRGTAPAPVPVIVRRP